MFNGIEIDMLSLGDADCVVVTEWTSFGPQRILVDGGKYSDAETIREFLHSSNFTNFWAVVCTHPHNDHARGLIEILKDGSFTIYNAWVHDIRNHMGADKLRSASSGNSSRAENVRQVLENTKEIMSVLARRNLQPKEPFAGACIAGSPTMFVLSPSLFFYRQMLEDFTESPAIFPPLPISSHSLLSNALGGDHGLSKLYAGLNLSSSLYASTPANTNFNYLSPLSGLLENSSVQAKPKTQPFNETSVVLGIDFRGNKLMLTGDAGSEALARVSPEWRHLLWLQVPHHGSDGNLSQRDIERLCPKVAHISACGDSSHPSRAIVSGLVKAGAKVFSTHISGHLHFYLGNVPFRSNYSYPAVQLKGTGNPEPIPSWAPLVPTFRPRL